MTKEQQLLFNVIRIMDFSQHRTYCSALEECLFKEIEQYLEEQEIKDYRLSTKEVVQPERLSEEDTELNLDFRCEKCLGTYLTCRCDSPN